MTKPAIQQKCLAPIIATRDHKDTGKCRTCEKPNGHTGLHLTYYEGKPFLWSKNGGTPAKEGYAVQITREDGSTFLAIGEDAPVAVFTITQRNRATLFKRGLVALGSVAKVVRVVYFEPEVIL